MPIAASSSADAAEHRHQHMLKRCARRRPRHDLVHRADVGDRQAASPGAAASWIGRAERVRLDLRAHDPRDRRDAARSARWPRPAPAPAGCTSSAADRCSSPPSRTSPTTPMICRSGSSANSRMTPRPMISRSFSGSPFGQNCLRHRLVDDHDRRRVPRVALGEGAAALDGNLEHVEVARRDRHPAAAAVERPVRRAAGRR